ncbi:hypothetical protein CVT26_001303 [Gymnopilus dilepis]|uniref:Uncharacterized protein n=1 Tax=Gymnopilus dilepis TaxID=231916 RepID=A0A409Y1Y0_9AGAR|nr:hypothetical protein CVT26_001303 [Gymnopilus dilepis]
MTSLWLHPLATCKYRLMLRVVSRLTPHVPRLHTEADVDFGAPARGHSHLRLQMRAGGEAMLLSRELEPLIAAFP